MTEKEKRDRGLYYNAGSDPELMADVTRPITEGNSIQ